MKELKLDLKQSEYEELIDTFMPSEDMKNHLKTVRLCPFNIMEMMFGSPVSLYIKREWFYKLSQIEQIIESEVDSINFKIFTFTDAYNEFMCSIDALETSYRGIYTVEDCWYDYDICERKAALIGAANDYQSVLTIIDDAISEELDMLDEDEKAEKCSNWFEVKKWGTKNGNYSYYFIGNTPIWFEKECIEINDKTKLFSSLFHFFDSRFLKLPIPYKLGDVIAIDTYPFGPTTPAIIYDIADSGRIIDVIAKDYKGKWHSGGLLNGDLGRSTYQNDWISPLYNIRKWTEPLYD